MEQQIILAMYSGGLDSLGMIYKLLTDPEYQDYKLHVHHIHNINVENRNLAESIAVNRAVKELRRLGFEFEYSDSQISSPPYNMKFMYDVDSVNFFAGYIASVNPNIVKIAMGMNATDSNQSLSERKKRGDAILAAFTSVEKIYPVLTMSKRELYDGLPDSLKDKFWSCRRPLYTEDGIEPCRTCRPCHQLSEAGIEV